jgi:hypothetical protein
MEKEETLRESLARQLDDVTWSGLRDHAARDGIILVDESMELLDTALVMAEDRSKEVAEWVEQGLLRKPTRDELNHYEACSEILFRYLIVAPFVLVQEMGN